MELQNVQNGGLRDINVNVTLSPYNRFIERCVRFYRAKFHFLSIPVVIVLVGIHLKYGIQYLGQCTIQPMINIYMIVHASADLLVTIIAIIGVLIVRCIYSRSDENNKILGRRLIFIVVIVSLIILLFGFAWLIAGSIWVFGAQVNGVQGSDPTATTTYCQSDLFKAVFILIIVHYVVHGLILLLIIFKHMFCKKKTTAPPLAATDKI